MSRASKTPVPARWGAFEPRSATALTAMLRDKLIEERIELRRWQSLDRFPCRPHFQYVGWTIYEWPFAHCRANDPGRHVEAVILRIHFARIIFKAPRISCLRSEDEHCHHGAAALTRNDLALNQFLGFRRARRRIDWSRLFRSCAKSRFHLARQFQPQGFEDCRPLRGHWVGWITNHFAGDMAAPVIQFLQQDAP